MGVYLKNRKYDYSNALTINDIITQEFVDGLKIKCSQVTSKFKRGRKVKRQFVQKIFFEFWNMVIDDCIENGRKFISASRNWFTIFIKEMNPESVGRILRNGKIYNNVDLLRSDGKFYNFVFYSAYLPRNRRYRSIRIGWTKYQQLIQSVNDGKRYFR